MESSAMALNTDTPKKEEIVNALDVEINHIRQEDQRPGWTTWTMLGALATVVWLILNEVDRIDFNFPNGLFLFLAISVTMDALTFFKGLVTYDPSPGRRKNRFYISSQLFTDNRSSLFLFLIRIALLLYIGSLFHDWLRAPTPIAFFLNYSIIWAAAAVILVLSFVGIPVPLSPAETPLGTTISALFVVLWITIVIAFVEACLSHSSSLNLTDYRFGGLLWSISFLLSNLVIGSNRPRLLDTLIELRRDLALGRIDVTSAIKQFDIALSGLQVSDLFQEQIKNVLALLEKANQEVKSAGECIEVATTRLSTNSGGALTPDEIKLVETTIDACEFHTERRKLMQQRLDKEIYGFAQARYSFDQALSTNEINS